ncbi:TonB-dependent receptor [Gilvimarinus sp. SDUM040013]|uniref:TonB-dependent receptor n=1 Tax=Gilvimarinus gilvus TaxID=3058038 RepID=A0ABU4RX21_9GAMM|nr:TonB-dependent receptor [Gilvimarinus sp. SDUM040013]MDO3387897.1 TonB-dependent receptor [Gilvimarinus sp. SDUM040013]MDX6848732.1 TonB-dependent receptor [Gilvimarinus sp. SDUM040013]
MIRPTRLFAAFALFTGINVFLAPASFANEQIVDTSEQDELLALLSLLEEETAVATQTNMNSDYVPGMVSVLHSEDLQNAGHLTVREALNQVAGFHSTLGNSGDSKTIVRGIGATLNASNLKLMINGVAFNRPTDGSADWVLRLPLEQVDRIEVIRGPGSPLYGEYAFSGTVNVITPQSNTLTARAGYDNSNTVTGNAYHKLDNGIELIASAGYWSNDASGNLTNLDNFADNGNGFSPAPIYDQQQGTSLFTGLGYAGFSAEWYFADMERGPWYGRNAAMPYELEPRQETVNKLQLQQNWAPLDSLDIRLQASYLQTELNHAAYLPIPAGVRGPGGNGVIESNDYLRDGAKDSEFNTEVSAHWRASEAHTLYFELGYSDSEVDSAFKTRQRDLGPALSAPDDALLVLPGAKREHLSFTVQDQWQINPQLHLTMGLRVDDYDDWGQHQSPRVAAVWQASDKHIIKTQYAEAFRPPTLSESYPGPNSFPGQISADSLSEESLKSTEIAYIYRSAGLKLSTTAFYIEVEDLIEFHLQPGEPPFWRNRGDITTQGVEFEWQQSIGRTLDWNANVSYADADDAFDEDGRLLGSIKWLVNAGVTWHASDTFDHTLQYRYVGEQEGWELRLRNPHSETFAAYNSLNYTLTVARVFGINGLSFRASAINLLDEHYNSVPTPAQYPHGLPQGERRLSGQFEYRF